MCLAKKKASGVSNLSDKNIKRYKKLKDTGKKIVTQTEKKLKGLKIKQRIVSYHESYAVALPKGKINKLCASLVQNYSFQ